MQSHIWEGGHEGVAAVIGLSSLRQGRFHTRPVNERRASDVVFWGVQGAEGVD